MTDHELLEKAAKAAGYEKDLQWGVHFLSSAGGSVKVGNAWVRWNPLADDADEARLEAALLLEVSWFDTFVLLFKRGGFESYREYYSDHGGDRQKARRRAGTRAAAGMYD